MKLPQLIATNGPDDLAESQCRARATSSFPVPDGKHRLLASPVRLFWLMSDYGQSTGRVIGTFFLLAALFAIIYGCIPGLVTDLHEADSEAVPASVLPFRALYFSVVTMTTLGFGDMFAAPASIAGHVLLMFHVILGYVLLGVLVTRLAILFQES